MLIQVLVALVGAVLVGAVLLVLGVRGKRLNDNPVCGWCRFDLSGVYPGVVTCPECGAGLKRAKAVRSGQRRRRPIAIALGALLVVLPTLGLGAGTLAMLAGEDLNAYKPVALLLWEGRHGGAATSRAAAVQLVQRMTSNGLSKDQVASTIAAALDIQQDKRRPWADEWGDLIEQARLDGVLTDEQHTRFCNQAAVLDFAVRPRVRIGDPVPVIISLKEARIGSTTSLYSSLMLGEVSINGSPARQAAPPGAPGGLFNVYYGGNTPHVGWLQMYGAGGGWGGMRAAGGGQLLLDLPADAAPGRATVSVALAVDTRVQTRNMSIQWGMTPDWKSPTVRRHEGAMEFAVESPDGPGVELVTPGPVQNQIEPILRPSMAHAYYAGPFGATHIMQTFSVDGLPVGVAYEVFWRQGSREQRLGTFTSGRSAEMWSGYYPGQDNTRQVNGQVNGFERKPVDVILRPSRDAAARTTDVFKIYNGEIVYEGVDVTWQDEGAVVRPSRGGVGSAIWRGLFGK